MIQIEGLFIEFPYKTFRAIITKIIGRKCHTDLEIFVENTFELIDLFKQLTQHRFVRSQSPIIFVCEMKYIHNPYRSEWPPRDNCQLMSLGQNESWTIMAFSRIFDYYDNYRPRRRIDSYVNAEFSRVSIAHDSLSCKKRKISKKRMKNFLHFSYVSLWVVRFSKLRGNHWKERLFWSLIHPSDKPKKMPGCWTKMTLTNWRKSPGKMATRRTTKARGILERHRLRKRESQKVIYRVNNRFATVDCIRLVALRVIRTFWKAVPLATCRNCIFSEVLSEYL